MKLTAEKIVPILKDYGITMKISDILILPDPAAKGEALTVRVEVKHRSPVILRIFKDGEKHELIERRAAFAEHMRKNGIPTPEHYSKDGSYCLERYIDGERADVTLEDAVGEPIELLDEQTAYQAGKLMARMHRISFRDNLKLGAGTLFNALGVNRVLGLEAFKKLAVKCDESQFKSVEYPHRLCTKPELLREISAICSQKLASARNIWDRLPRCAVQGAFTMKNLLRSNEGALMISDFGMSGDVTLLGDMLLEGFLLADSATVGQSDALKGDLIMKNFVEGYTSTCPLTPDERIAACDIYPVYNALRLSKISADGGYSDALEAVLAAGDCKRSDEKLAEIYALINEDARKFFAKELFN